MASAENLLNYPDCTISFTVHTDYSDKIWVLLSTRKINPLFFSRRLSKPQSNYTKTSKEPFLIVECINKLYGILFGYGINLFSYHNNLVYAATLSESQRVMRWRLILKEFGPNIQNISGVDNIIDDTLSIFPYIPLNK